MDRTIIDEYERGGEKLQQAIAGMSDGEMKAMPIPGKWSTQQVVIHLADAEAAMADRIRRIVAEDKPLLVAWDENQFAARLHYDAQSVNDALQMVILTRRQLARVLRKLPDGDFDRVGQHSERGPITAAETVKFANWHLDHHLKFIAEKRAALGKNK